METTMRIALFAHLISLVVGFGAVLVVDFCGLLWVLNRKPTRDILTLTSIAQPLIWLGFLGLIVSGLFLHPNLHSVWTRIKLLAVVVTGLNGIYLHYLRGQTKSLGDVRFADTPMQYKLKSFAGITLSQLGWWTAIIIGFLTATNG